MINITCDRCGSSLDDYCYEKTYYRNGTDEHICPRCITDEEKEDADYSGFIR